MTRSNLTSTGPLFRHQLFVIYHPADRSYYDAFSRLCGSAYDTIAYTASTQMSGGCADFEVRHIVERYVNRTVCAVVLVGPLTSGRTSIDWQIKASLDGGQKLIGLELPNIWQHSGRDSMPPRLRDNVESGYAVWLRWHQLSSMQELQTSIAIAKSRNPALIKNHQELAQRRHTARLPLDMPCSVLLPDGRWAAEIRDISKTGLRFRCHGRLDDRKRVTIELPNQRRLNGTVVWKSGDMYGLALTVALPSSDPLILRAKALC